MGKTHVPREFCDHVLDCNRNIRYAGIADGRGKIVMTKYRVPPLLSIKDTERSVRQSVLRMHSRKAVEAKIGKTIYASAVYTKIKRATIPLKNDLILMVSFESQANHHAIIIKKILPLAKKYGLRAY